MTSSTKNLLYRAAVGLGIAALGRRRDAAPVLCFHNVVDDERAGRVGDASLHMGLTSFRQAIDVVTEHYEVISLGEFLGRRTTGASLRGCCVLTFDDAYVGTIRLALPELRRAGLPSTVFVVTDAAESPAPFWWDVLGDRGELAALRDQALSAHQGRTARVPGGVAASVGHPDLLPASWDAVLTAARSEYVAIGSHTCSHPNLLAIPDDELALELRDAISVLRDRVSGTLPVVAYPYGNVDTRVAHHAKAAGYIAGMALGRRVATRANDPFTIPRLNIPAGISAEALETWISGF